MVCDYSLMFVVGFVLCEVGVVCEDQFIFFF